MIKTHFARGAAGQQYAIVVGLIAVVALLGVTRVGGNVSWLFGSVSNTVTSASNGTIGGGGQQGGNVAGLAFTSLNGQAWNAAIPSNTATVSGFSGALAVSVSGEGTPQVSINGGAFGAGGSVTAGQTVQVRLTTANGANQTRTATVTVGSTSAGFAVTTIGNGGPWVFTSCGINSGRAGPIQSDCNTAYNSSNTLHNQVTVTNGIQGWVIPATGSYQIEAAGAAGASSSHQSGGRGARVRGKFALTAGTPLSILVGQVGLVANPGNNYTENGGGGGTFVVRASDTAALVVAGGGGGARGYINNCGLHQDISDAVLSNNGVSVPNCPTTASGGTGGLGGASNSSHGGSAGAGFTGDGGAGSHHCNSNQPGAKSFTNGGAGADASLTSCYNPRPSGGFGGGGRGGLAGAGGGGGYSGGASSGSWSGSAPPGGGGGSYTAGFATDVTGDVGTNGNTGAGMVTITLVGPGP